VQGNRSNLPACLSMDQGVSTPAVEVGTSAVPEPMISLSDFWKRLPANPAPCFHSIITCRTSRATGSLWSLSCPRKADQIWVIANACSVSRLQSSVHTLLSGARLCMNWCISGAITLSKLKQRSKFSHLDWAFQQLTRVHWLRHVHHHRSEFSQNPTHLCKLEHKLKTKKTTLCRV
jgi:hypothetical protein